MKVEFNIMMQWLITKIWTYHLI